MTHPLDPIDLRHNGLPVGGYAQLANVRGLPVEQVQLADDLVLRRATSEEVGELQLLIQLYGPRHVRVSPYEYSVTAEPRPPQGSFVYHYHELPEGEHRYVVLDFTGSSLVLYALLRASCLTDKPVELGAQVLRMGAMTGTAVDHGLERAFAGFQSDEHYMVDLEHADVEDLQDVLARIRASDAPRIATNGTIDQYLQLRMIPRHMPIRFLGCFAILESLLAHKPKPSDPYESLGRQVRRKLALLQNRFRACLTYPGKIDHAKFWGEMYGYRSSIAHGEFAEPPKALGSRTDALQVLEVATAKVMRAALYEPQLLADLREC